MLVGRETFVCGAVEVDRKGGKGDKEIACKALRTKLIVLFPYDTPCKPQGTVKEGVPKPAAVRLCVESRIIPVRKSRIFLELECRRIGMTCYNLESFFGIACTECDDRAPAAYDKILSAVFQIPCICFRELGKAFAFEQCACIVYCLIGGIRGFEKLH